MRVLKARLLAERGAATAEYAIATLATVDSLERIWLDYPVDGDSTPTLSGYVRHMGRKETSNELLAMRALEEQRWAYERKLEHMSIREMRALVQRSPGEGGLGYDISEHGLRKLVTAYMGRMADVEADSVDFHRQRELADMDARQRAHNVMVDPINRAKLRLVADRLGITPDEVIAEHPDLVPWRDEKVILNALAGLEKVAAERRKLLGLDAPSQVHVAVTTHDAVTDELNDMLARAGRKTIEVG